MESNDNALLTDEQVERLIQSLLQARERKGKILTEEEAMKLCSWATLAIVNYQCLTLLFNGEIEINEFDAKKEDVWFTTPERAQYETPLMHSLAQYIEDKFAQDSSGG